jgi:hypothetical protein
MNMIRIACTQYPGMLRCIMAASQSVVQVMISIVNTKATTEKRRKRKERILDHPPLSSLEEEDMD